MMMSFTEWAKQKKHLNEFMADFSDAGNTQPQFCEQNTPLIFPQSQRNNRTQPKSGDPAYSIYKGIRAEGVLQQNKYMRDGIFDLITKGKNPWFINPNHHLSVGRDEPIVWDNEKHMWYAPADYD